MLGVCFLLTTFLLQQVSAFPTGIGNGYAIGLSLQCLSNTTMNTDTSSLVLDDLDVSGDLQSASVVATADQATNNNATRKGMKNIWLPPQVDVYHMAA